MFTSAILRGRCEGNRRKRLVRFETERRNAKRSALKQVMGDEETRRRGGEVEEEVNIPPRGMNNLHLPEFKYGR